MPSYIPAKSRDVVDRAADVMRGRGVPSSRQDLQEAEAEAERRARETEEIRLEKIRVDAVRLQTITEARLQKIRAAHEYKEKRFKKQLEGVVLSMAASDSQMRAVGWINAQVDLVELRSHEIALIILEGVFGDTTLRAAPLSKLLDKLKFERERRWTGLLEEILEQKREGQFHHKFSIAASAANAGLTALVNAIGEIDGRMGEVLRFVRVSLQLSHVALEAHVVRSWDMVALRNKLMPDIFSFEVRSALLGEKLSEALQSAQEISIQIRALGKQISFNGYTFIHERIRILSLLLRSKAEVARDTGGFISGFRLPSRHQAHNTAGLCHEALIEAELARIAMPIIRLVGMFDVLEVSRDIASEDLSFYQYHGAHDRLATLRCELAQFNAAAPLLTRRIRRSLTSIVFWRGLQLQHQSQWGQASFPRSSHQPRGGITSSVDVEVAVLSPSAPTAVERYKNHSICASQPPNVTSAGGPAISYVTTTTFAHTVLEDFRSSSVLGLDILSSSSFEGVSSTSHRSQIEVLVLASESHIAIFHIALFEGWDPLLLHIPALKEILESTHVLKVGVNMARYAEFLKNHTTVDMDNFVDLNECTRRHDLTRNTVEGVGDCDRSDGVSELTAKCYGIELPSISQPEKITRDGLVRGSYIRYLASRSYAALRLYSTLQQPSSAQETILSHSLRPQILGQFNVLARYTRRITIDPYWQQDLGEFLDTHEVKRLKIRTRHFSLKARSRKLCLDKIVEDLANTLIDQHHDHTRARTMQERRRNKAKIDCRRQDLKAMYLRIFFYEYPENILGCRLPFYSAHRVLKIAKQHEIDVPPDRKAELEAEIRIGHSHSDPRARAEAWLDSILKSATSDVLIARPSTIRSVRQKLLREHHRDILLVFAVWQVTPASETEIASLFFTTAEQVRSDVLLIDSLKLLRPVKHKLERLLALTQQIEVQSSDGSYPDSPSFKSTFQISRAHLLTTVTAADKVATARLVNLKQAAGEQRWSIATDPHGHRRSAVSAARVKRRKRERGKRKLPKLNRSAALKAPAPANSLALYVPNEMHTGSARAQNQPQTIMRSIMGNLELPSLPDAELLQSKEAKDVDNSSMRMTAEEQALRNASFQFQPQSRSKPQFRASNKARPSSDPGRRTSMIGQRVEGKPKPLAKRVENGFRMGRFSKSTRGKRLQTS